MRLDPCPASPNCVSTQADPSDQKHYIEPVPYEVDPSQVIDAVTAAVMAAGGQVIDTRADGVDALFVTKIFRFKDDATFLLDTEAKLLHFRSASRTGHSDLGANRTRMQQLVVDLVGRMA